MSDFTKKEIVTRFPPSPTGDLHIGGARTALFNWLVAQKYDGRFVLRFEDTDTARSEKRFAQTIKESLDWLGLDYDGPYFQSERTAIYRRYLEEMLESGAAYVSDESDSEEGRDEVIRFKNPNKEITFSDKIRGEVTTDTTDLGDFVIAKSLSEPLYHLAVVVDDHEMGINVIIRGDEHISNTPRQLLMIDALELERPEYAHIPLILGADGKKLSKRHGATSTLSYRDNGVLGDAMINYLTLLGWHPSDDKEIFTPEELIEEFSVDRVQKGPATFKMDKLRWVNRQHILKLSEEEFYDEVRAVMPEDMKKLPQYDKVRLRSSLPILRERLEIFSDVVDLANGGELEFLFEAPNYSAGDISWKEDTPKETAGYLAEVSSQLGALSDDEFDHEEIKAAVWDYASEVGRGNVLWPMRFALSGREQSPGPFMIAEAIGREETLDRLETAVNKLKDASQ